MTYYKIARSSYLAHHGILGQKWGKRNGPPYPLGVSDHSNSEKKAGWRKSLDRNKKTKSDKKSSFKLTDKQKKYIKIGLAVAGTAAVVGVSVYLLKTGKAKTAIRLGKNAANLFFGKGAGDESFITKSFGSISSEKSKWENVLTDSDPHRGSHNCMAVSIAMLERHNHKANIVAKDIQHGLSISDILKIYPGSTDNKIKNILDLQDLEAAMYQEYPQGGNGIIAFFSSDRAKHPNHALTWSIEKGVLSLRDGQYEIIDTAGNLIQKGISMDVLLSSRDELNDYFSVFDFSKIHAIRLDNVPIVEDSTILDKYFEKG